MNTITVDRVVLYPTQTMQNEDNLNSKLMSGRGHPDLQGCDICQ